jgi:molecular chaperone DnaK (HSP70)
MPAIAIDFGTMQMKVACFDTETGKGKICLLYPSLLYLPPAGPPVTGDDALEAVAIDPKGIVRDLKRAFYPDRRIPRHARTLDPIELAAA